MSRIVILAVLTILLLEPSIVMGAETTPGDLVFELDKVSSPQTTLANLIERFGEANVTTEQIYLGEGTVLFKNTDEEKVKILWKNHLSKKFPKIVRIRGKTSRWCTIKGLKLGLDLLAVEKLNRRPFRLAGFAWDYEGGVLSWSGGSLEVQGTDSCTIGARLRPEAQARDGMRLYYNQVQGDREFSSGHPAMQALNPSVYMVTLRCGR
jgi:hypothetical protein